MMLVRTKYTSREDNLKGVFRGKCFILCPGPSLKNYAVEKLPAPRIAINSAVTQGVPDFWVMGDNPGGFRVPGLWDNPNLWKIVRYNYHSVRLGTTHLRDFPGVLLMKTTLVKKPQEVSTGFPWLKNTFFLGLYLARYLGFTQICILGSDLKVGPKPYVHDQPLTSHQAMRNQALYNTIPRYLRELREQESWRGVSITQGGKLPSLGIPLEEVK